jgi:hypothetical protein
MPRCPPPYRTITYEPNAVDQLLTPVRAAGTYTISDSLLALQQQQSEADLLTEAYLVQKGYVYEGTVYFVSKQLLKPGKFDIVSAQPPKVKSGVPLRKVPNQEDRTYIADALREYWVNGRKPRSPIEIYSKPSAEDGGTQFYVGQ